MSCDVICLDGPAGAGKSTLARELARALGWTYLDSGAIYRALAATAVRRGLDPADREAAEALAGEVRLKLQTGPEGTRVSVDGEDVTHLLRAPEISQKASVISAWPGVRAALLSIQRSIGAKGQVVAEGRDMGTVVFPGARLKFFLTAGPEARAERRYLELKAKGVEADRGEVLKDMIKRDQADESRAAAPLTAAPDAVLIDSTRLDIAGVLTALLAGCTKAGISRPA